MTKFEKLQNGSWGVRVSGAELAAVNAGESRVAVRRRDGQLVDFELGVMVGAGADGSLVFCSARTATARKGGGNDPDARL